MKSRTSGGSTRGGQARETLRGWLLEGRWQPGDRLQPVALAEETGWSTTVVREALTHLAGEGLLTIQPNKGFFVPQLSLDELTWITELRCRTEELAVGLALERGDLAWESDLIAAHHRLTRTMPRDEADGAFGADWLEAHHAFHGTLIAACGVDKLCEIASNLNDATMLFRRWALPSKNSQRRDVAAEHQEILEAALARDVVLTQQLLRKHYESTLAHIAHAGLRGEATVAAE